MQLKGRAIKVGDSISTDLICPGRLFHLRNDIKELSKHIFEDLDPALSKKIKHGHFIVAGKNFGLGSSREHAALVLKISGISCILASSFARIFFRNAINNGLPVFECDTRKIKEGDKLSLDLNKEIVRNDTRGTRLKIRPLPGVMQDILKEGGLISYIRKFKCLH
ncbi:MAG: 3-isopropylmalate dehydratase small subunit [Candidatus Omnitrophica bacterium]|nr:3-isopropylmalate dehydratase small subunit [Candidatus Omnitrophota bacterium]